MPPSIDLDWILNWDKIFDAFSERFPDLHIVKTSLLKLSFWINFKSDSWSKWLRGIDIEPSIAEEENSSFSLTSIRRISWGFALYKTKPNKILLIDVREYEEFSSYAIEGSISIPLSHLNQDSDLGFIQKESLVKEVFTICKSGKRSEKASRILSKFKIESRSIDGGIEMVKNILGN